MMIVIWNKWRWEKKKITGERNRERQKALSPWPSIRSWKKEWEKEKKVHGQIHLPLLQSISGQKKYTITRQEEAKINGPPTSPLTSIHLHPIPPLSLSLCLFHMPSFFQPFSHLIPLSFYFSPPPPKNLTVLPHTSPFPLPLHTLPLPHAVIYRFCWLFYKCISKL